jgi:WD40 repeat protein
VRSVAFYPDGKRVLSGSDDFMVRIWDAEIGEEQAPLEGHHDRVRSVAWSPDGKRVLSGSRDETIRIWDMATGEEQTVLKGHHNGVWSVAFSPDGKCVLSGSDDNTTRIWNAVGRKWWCLKDTPIGYDRSPSPKTESEFCPRMTTGQFAFRTSIRWDSINAKFTPMAGYITDGMNAYSGFHRNTVVAMSRRMPIFLLLTWANLFMARIGGNVWEN